MQKKIGWLVGLVLFYGISTIVGYLMPDPLYINILNIWFGLVVFYGISTIVGYLMPNPIYTYVRGAYDKFPDFFFFRMSTFIDRTLMKL